MDKHRSTIMAMHRKSHRFAIGVAAAAALICGPALAQSRSAGGTQGAAGTRGAGGTRSAAPRGIPGGQLGGVRSAAPRGIGRVPPLLRQAPDRSFGSQRSFTRPSGRFRDVRPLDRDDTFFRRGSGGFVRRPVDDDDRFRARFDRDGFRAAALLRNDDDRLFLRLGPGGVPYITDDRVLAPRGYFRHNPYRHVRYGYSAFYPYGPYSAGFGGYNTIYDTRPVYTVGSGYADPNLTYGPQYLQPPPPSAAPVPELTQPERAAILLASGRPSLAVEVYQDHLRDSPDDADAMRDMAVAMLEAGREREAVAVAALAYDKDPSLATRPISTRLFSGPMDLRQALNDAVAYANRVNSASSWLLVASLMQAEGRDRVASRMIDRAIELGLSERVAGAMRSELAL